MLRILYLLPRPYSTREFAEERLLSLTGFQACINIKLYVNNKAISIKWLKDENWDVATDTWTRGMIFLLLYMSTVWKAKWTTKVFSVPCTANTF